MVHINLRFRWAAHQMLLFTTRTDVIMGSKENFMKDLGLNRDKP